MSATNAVVGVGLVALMTGTLAQQPGAPPAELQRVEITGSHLPQLQTETTSPVQVINRDEIRRSGATSVFDVLERLAPGSIGLSDVGGNGLSSPGASAASLRGLPFSATLVLLNFRRVSPYPLADDTQIFVNIDSLPLEAVERIEILKGGASAIYGSEAIAGVINIITRPGFKGMQAHAAYERSQSSHSFGSRSAGISAGFGDIAADGFNGMVTLDLYQRDQVIWRDVLSDINPAYFAHFKSLGSFSTYSTPGNLIGKTAAIPAPGCDPTLVVNGLCRYDRYRRFEAIPQAERANAFASAQMKLDHGMTGFAELLLSDTRTVYVAPFLPYGSGLGPSQWVVPSTGEAKTFTYRGLPTTNPLNVFGEDELEFRYRFADGARETDVRTRQYRALAGLRGNWRGFDWESAAGLMGGHTDMRQRGEFSDSGFKQVIGNYDPAQTDPQFFNRAYKIGQVNSPSVIDTLFPAFGYRGGTAQAFVDGRLAGDWFSVPAGALRVATGFDLRHETFKVEPSANLRSGDIVGSGLTATDAARTYGAVYAESGIPLARALTLETAGRVDKFPGFDAHLSPKLGLRFEVSKALALRGAVEAGFRAPNLVESADSTKYGFKADLNDPKRCPQAQALMADLQAAAAKLPPNDPQRTLLIARADNVQFVECHAATASVARGNPALRPETSRSATLGLAFQPRRELNITVDYWSIESTNQIGIKNASDLLLIEDSLQPGAIARGDLSRDTTFSIAERAKYGVTAGPLALLSARYENGSRIRTSGIDVALASTTATPLGRLGVGFNGTYLLSYRTYSTALGAYNENVAGRGAAHWTVIATATLQRGDFAHGVQLNYSGPTTFTSFSTDTLYTPADCAKRGWTPDECRVKARYTVDYNLGYSGVKDLRLSLVVRNLFGRRPPLNLANLDAGGGGIIPQDTSDVKRRMVAVAVEYRFR